MSHLIIWLTVSGCITLCLSSYTSRKYYLIDDRKNWTDAQRYCREKFDDLAVIASQDDLDVMVNLTNARGVTAEIWVGLRKTGPPSWLWSAGETQSGPGSVDWTNWATIPLSTENCGGMLADGKWFGTSCETTHPFVCEEDSGSMEVYIEGKTWKNAQDHCRQLKKDLAEARNAEQNLALQQKLSSSSAASVWIGLFRDEWKWSDQSPSSFRHWESSQPNNDGNCTLYYPSGKSFYDRGCAQNSIFYCYRKEKTAEQFFKVEIMSSGNLNDSTVWNAILNELNAKYEGVKFQWKLQPDGKIFHKKKKKADDAR
ncbi:unnamed protein product [Menidia menidia]|uniref:(Atlantic silverside) hypothetical protein n=1 Tax=Menidia menidia TaxID=238744 RepID=A0A8S4B3D6_9TELE|nr:unnamed protein product [Menidia menidia]